MPSRTTSEPTIEQVRELSALVTASVDVADVQVTELRGWTGGIRVALLVKGQYLLGTDLNQCRFEKTDHSTKTAVLVLTPPTVTTPRLDHDRTKVYAVTRRGLWQIVPTDHVEVTAVNQAMREAQASLAAVAGDERPIQRARRQAETVLGSFFRTVGWDVTIRWSDRP